MPSLCLRVEARHPAELLACIAGRQRAGHKQRRECRRRAQAASGTPRLARESSPLGRLGTLEALGTVGTSVAAQPSAHSSSRRAVAMCLSLRRCTDPSQNKQPVRSRARGSRRRPPAAAAPAQRERRPHDQAACCTHRRCQLQPSCSAAATACMRGSMAAGLARGGEQEARGAKAEQQPGLARRARPSSTGKSASSAF